MEQNKTNTEEKKEIVYNNLKSLKVKFKKNHFHERIITQTLELKNRKYTKREYRDRYFFPDEYKVFYDHLKESQKLTFNFLINTGARINEIRNVEVRDIDFERNGIVFRWTKSRNKDGSRRIRTIPISSQFCKYLKGIIRERNLELTDKFPILSTPAANIGMKKALVTSNIPDWKMFSIHNIRKTMEMWLLALDVDSSKVEKHMGHTLAVAMKFYVSPELFSWDDKNQMREIIGDLYLRR